MSDSRFSLQKRKVSPEQMDAIFTYHSVSGIGLIPCSLNDSISGIAYDAFLFLHPNQRAQLAFNDIDDLLNQLLQKEDVQGIVDSFAYSIRDTLSDEEKEQFDYEVAKIKLERLVSSR